METRITSGRWKTEYLVDAEEQPISKKCRKCNEMKPLDSYYEKSDCLFGRRSECIECENQRFRDYYYQNRQQLIRDRMIWRNDNLEKDNEARRKWLERNRETVNKRRTMYATNINRAARDFGLPAEFTVKDKESLLEKFGGCALSGETDNIHFDHVIPLSTGYGGTISWNILPMKAGLNISKGKKNIFEWFYANKERFGLDEGKFQEAIQYLAAEKGTTVQEYEDFVYSCFK